MPLVPNPPEPIDLCRLAEEPPLCPRCSACLPGIDTQKQLRTFLRVRCANNHFWERPWPT